MTSPVWAEFYQYDHQGHVVWEGDCFPKEIWVPDRPTPGVHYKWLANVCDMSGTGVSFGPQTDSMKQVLS